MEKMKVVRKIFVIVQVCETKNLEGKLHSKILISDPVDLFWKSSMVRVQGQEPNRNMVKHAAENGQKISGYENAAGVTSLMPCIKTSRLQIGLEFGQAYRRVSYDVVTMGTSAIEWLP